MPAHVDHFHPFRKFNGRTQRQYLNQPAGYNIDPTRIDRAAWLDALRRSNTGHYEAITHCVRQAFD